MFTFADQEREWKRALLREREEGEKRGEKRGEERGFFNALVTLVQKHLLPVKDAAKQANMSEDEFLKKAGLGM